MKRVSPVPSLLLAAAAMTMGCTHNVMPKVTPEKIPAVEPPIASRALLLLPPSFEMYGLQESNGIHKWRYHLGEAMAGGLADLVGKSFVHGEARHVPDDEVLRWLTGPPDTAGADLLLVPHFEEGDMAEGLLKTRAEARLRLDVRSFRTGRTLSWRIAGRKSSMFQSMKGLTGNAIEQALRGLSDSLAAHRKELEARESAAVLGSGT